MKNKLVVLATFVIATFLVSMVQSHCQIPCGIYDDPARLDAIAEHTITIEKSIKQITELSKAKQPNMNQVVRWVQNKDNHADQLSHIVTYYFMAQRLKPAGQADAEAHQKYMKKLTLLHEMLIYSMKTKQSTDLANVEKLKTLLAEFRTAYFKTDDNKQ